MLPWEVFPEDPWPRGFGHREIARHNAPINPDQLELAHELVMVERREPPVAEKLREAIARSGLTRMQFAHYVIGCTDVTLYRYLRGASIPEDRRNWLRRLESVTVHGHHLVTVVRCGNVEPRRWPRKRWSYSRTG